MAEKSWIAFFFVIVALWILVLASTIYLRMYGAGILIDTDFNLTYFTLPILLFNLAFVGMLIFVFSVYLASYNRTTSYQMKMKEQMSKKFRDQMECCSIIIPARNEESVIKRTVLDCLRQTYQNIEIIVICHNCTDRTYEEALCEDSRVKVFALNTKESGKGIALNYGVEKANGNYVLVLDSDGFLNHDFIENALPLFDGNYAAVQGRYVPSNRSFNFVTRMLALEGDLWSTPFMTVRNLFGRRTPLGGTGYIIRKDILEKVGMFANHLVDDYELTFRLLRNGYRIVFAPYSINYDEKPPTLESMLRQRARWGRGFINLLKMRIAEGSDVLGNFYWLNPVTAITGLIMLLIPAYAAIHFLMFDYYPYTYAYIPLDVWFVLTGVLYFLQAAVLVREYGRKGLAYAAGLPALTIFSHYWFATFIKAFTIQSWANTKTTHGFLKETKSEKMVADAS